MVPSGILYLGTGCLMASPALGFAFPAHSFHLWLIRAGFTGRQAGRRMALKSACFTLIQEWLLSQFFRPSGLILGVASPPPTVRCLQTSTCKDCRLWASSSAAFRLRQSPAPRGLTAHRAHFQKRPHGSPLYGAVALPENFPVLPVAIPRANLSYPQDTGISPHGSAHAPVPFNRPNSLPTERGNHLLFINFSVKSVGRDFEDSRGARRDKPIHGHLWGFNVY